MEVIKVTYPSNNLDIPAYVHRPTKQLAKHPIGYVLIVLLIIAIALHGGMFVLGNASVIPKSQVSWLTAAGFVVVAPEFRLCPHVDVWSGPVQDCLQFHAWITTGGLRNALEKHSITVDIERIVVLGHQSGGTLAQILVCPLTSADTRVILRHRY
jgi:acetyl esterase/lipase